MKAMPKNMIVEGLVMEVIRKTDKQTNNGKRNKKIAGLDVAKNQMQKRNGICVIHSGRTKEDVRIRASS